VVVVGVVDGLRPVVCAGLGEQVVDVGFDGGSVTIRRAAI
jgi:hypothetical protein